ncbi:MAG: LytTR family transcriptional regulator [Oscillibacter sp.]|nr:LytTR family transcriptional regulator [Oscillibacter sp.]
MQSSDLIQRSIFIVTEFYQNNIRPWLDSADEEICWIGPAVGQLLQGRRALIAAWTREENPLTFTMGDIQAFCAAASPESAEVMLTYPLAIHYPSGKDLSIFQRLHLTWVERTVDGSRREPRILMTHTANPYYQSELDTIYPVHSEALAGSIPLPVGQNRYLTLRGTDRATYFLSSGNIYFLESAHNGQHSAVHMRGSVISAAESLAVIQRTYPDLFLRIHSGYLINPYHVRDIRRFSVTMADGTVLPVPEKKYTAVKRALLETDRQAASSAPGL